jgi:hypothetical protein
LAVLGEKTYYTMVGGLILGIGQVEEAFNGVLERITEKEGRFAALCECIEKAPALHALTYFIGRLREEHCLGKDRGRTLDESDRKVNKEHLDDLQRRLVERIVSASKDNSLYEHEYLSPLLHTLRRWGNEEELRPILEVIESDTNRLINLISSAFNYGEVFGGTSDREYYKDVSSLGEIIDVDRAYNMLFALSKSSELPDLNEEQARGIKLFLEAYEKRPTEEPEDTAQ